MMENLDFEILFFENILNNCPDFVEALIALGNDYTKRGRYEGGLKIDQRLAQLRPEDELVHYNLACRDSYFNAVAATFRLRFRRW